MSVDEASSSHKVKLRHEAEQRLAMEQSEGGFWYSVADCQRMVHELQVTRIEMDLIGDELEAHNRDMRAWREEADQLQQALLDATRELALAEEGHEKNAVAMRCLEATLHLFEGRFRLLMQGDVTDPK